MEVATVTAPTGGLLAAVRSTLADAEEALVCVAFAQTRGVHLIGQELAALSSRGGSRVLVTTVLGSTPAPAPDIDPEESIDPELLVLITSELARDSKLYTLGPTPKLNVVRDAGPSGLWVETDRTRDAKTSAQLVPPRMLNLAWDVLRSRGELSNRTLLDELRVHRSSFVCALLSRVPGVVVVSSRPIVLRYRGPVSRS